MELFGRPLRCDTPYPTANNFSAALFDCHGEFSSSHGRLHGPIYTFPYKPKQPRHRPNHILAARPAAGVFICSLSAKEAKTFRAHFPDSSRGRPNQTNLRSLLASP